MLEGAVSYRISVKRVDCSGKFQVPDVSIRFWIVYRNVDQRHSNGALNLSGQKITKVKYITLSLCCIKLQNSKLMTSVSLLLLLCLNLW
jgi:hypothetical protein